MGGTTGKVVIGLIMIAVLMIIFPLVMTATHDLQTDDQADADLAITTDDVTLTLSLWDDDVASVLLIVGNGTEEAGAITAASYVAGTKVLTLAGVIDSTTATVTYATSPQVDADLAITTNDVTLTLSLWNADVASVLLIVGNGTEEAGAITAASYVEGTKVLTLAGVIDSTTATVTYATSPQADADLAITTDDATLTVSLWKAAVGSVLSIVGNGTEEAGAITAASYVEATKVLTLAGVTDSTTATVTYEIDGLTDYTGMGTLVGITPLLIWIAILAAVLGGIWFSVKGRG